MITKRLIAYDSYISDKNFDDIESHETFNVSIEKKNENLIILKFKHTYSTNMYYVFPQEGGYYFSLNYKVLAEMFDENQIFTNNNLFSSIEFTKENFEINVQVINDLGFQSVPIKSREAGIIIENWLRKYKKLIGEIDPDRLTIQMSSGFDTRNLSYFWRNTGKLYDIYTANKPDEVNEALEVIKLLPARKVSHISYPDRLTLNGAHVISRSHGLRMNDWINNLGSSNPKINKSHLGKNKIICKGITPFYDKEIMKINMPKPPYCIKHALAYLLTKDSELFTLPYKSFKREIIPIDDQFIKTNTQIVRCWGIDLSKI